MIRELIVETFDAEVKRIFNKSAELQKFILDHERKNLCIDNLHREIAKVDLSGKKLLNRQIIIDLSKSICNVFCKAAVDAKIKEMTKDYGISRPGSDLDIDSESEQL